MARGQQPVGDLPTGQPVRMSRRQAGIVGVLAGAFAATAIAVAHLLPLNRPIEPLVLIAVVALSVAAVVPLLWRLSVFSSERRQGCTARLELDRACRGTVMLLADLVEADDDHTGDHSRAVVELVSAVADELDVHPPEREELEFAALLHDVGKISIPKTILNKPAALTEEEYALMKTHTVEGQGLLDRVGGPLGRIGETVRSCHERWDGTGYPDGLAGPDIPWAARIVFACDAYDAMTTDRPYRGALTPQAALQEMWASAGHQFDARIVAALSKVVRCGRVAVAPSRTQDVRTMLASAALPAAALPAVLDPAHEDARAVAERRSPVAVGTAVA